MNIQECCRFVPWLPAEKQAGTQVGALRCIRNLEKLSAVGARRSAMTPHYKRVDCCAFKWSGAESRLPRADGGFSRKIAALTSPTASSPQPHRLLRLLGYVRPYSLAVLASVILLALTGLLDAFRVVLIRPI